MLKKARLRPEWELPQTVPGIGKILRLTIMYEAGEMNRFATPGDFTSYCRCVDARRARSCRPRMTRPRSRRASRNRPAVEDAWIAAVRSRVLRWGRRNFASYPWREDRDPWLTLIAELLLQRTRAAQVLPVYEAFRARYPTPRHLLRSGRRGVRALTSRVGLHARGETLLALARLFDRGGPPSDRAELREVTGVGAYTAAAWLSLHCGRREAIAMSFAGSGGCSIGRTDAILEACDGSTSWPIGSPRGGRSETTTTRCLT